MSLQRLLLLICLIRRFSCANGAFSTPFFGGKDPFSGARARTTFFAVGAEETPSSSASQNDNGEATTAELEAEELRKRSKELLAEARAMEVALGDNNTDISKRKNQESDDLIEALFKDNTTSAELSERLADERWSPEQLTLVIERLHGLQVQALGRTAGKSTGFQIGNTSNKAEPDEEEWNRLNAQIECLLEAAGILDDKSSSPDYNNQNQRWTGRVSSSLRSRLKELRRTDEQEFERKLATSVNAAVANTNVSVQEYMSSTLGTPIALKDKDGKSMNITLILEAVSMIPMWVPSSLVPFLVTARSKIESEYVKTIRDDVLTANTGFYLTSSDAIPGAAIFRGNIRTPLGVVNTTMERNQTAVVFEDIQERLKGSGLSDRIQLFFLNDPEWRPGRDAREPVPKPVVLALPAEVVPEQGTDEGYASLALKTVSVSATVLTTFAYSISCYGLNPNFFSSIVEKNDITVLIACLPIFVGVLAVQAIHEVAKYFVAKRAKVRIGRPVLLPSFQIGTFGSIVPLRSFPADRTALFDFALSGPVAGFAASILLILGGVSATVYASASSLVQFPVVPVALLKGSYFIGSVLSFLAPKVMILPSSQPVPVHPLFLIGFAGLIANALNMLPIGRLDGGRAYTAVFGARNASVASTLTLAFLALLSLTGMSNIAIFWGALVVLFQRYPEIPVRDEVTEVDDFRVGIYVGALALTIMILAPFPTGQGML